MVETPAVSVFPGFMHISFRCPYCGHQWEGVSFVGNIGVECPACHLRKDDFAWLPDADSPDRADMPHDGCWLWGDSGVRSVTQAALAAACAPEPEPVIVVQTVRPPWWVRLMAFVVGWWYLRAGMRQREE